MNILSEQYFNMECIYVLRVLRIHVFTLRALQLKIIITEATTIRMSTETGVY